MFVYYYDTDFFTVEACIVCLSSERSNCYSETTKKRNKVEIRQSIERILI